MILALFGNRGIKISAKLHNDLEQILTRQTPPRFVKVKGQTIKVADIMGLFTDEQWDELEHERLGDFKCSFGHWHKKYEQCAHTEKPKGPPIDLSYLREDPEKKVGATTKDEWLRLIRTNWQIQKQTGRYGTLKTLEDLAQYDETGETPEYQAPARHRAKTVVVDENYQKQGYYQTFNPDGTYYRPTRHTFLDLLPPDKGNGR